MKCHLDFSGIITNRVTRYKGMKSPKITQKMHNNKVNLFFTDNTIQSAQFFPHPFISCTMKEKYCGSQKGVNRCKSRIQRHILIVFRQESKDETGKYQRSDNQIGPLHDFGRQPLSLVQARNSAVVFRSRGLNTVFENPQKSLI